MSAARLDIAVYVAPERDQIGYLNHFKDVRLPRRYMYPDTDYKKEKRREEKKVSACVRACENDDDVTKEKRRRHEGRKCHHMSQKLNERKPIP